MSVEWKLLETFLTRPEAEMAQDLLKQVEIPSRLKADDAQGLYPTLVSTSGIQLFVPIDDYEEAWGIVCGKKG